MDVQKALDIAAKASNTEHLKYVKEQFRHFKIEPTSSLKEYFDFIYNDTLTWLQTLPNNARSKPTFNKYKASIYHLLESTEVVNAFGSHYCADVSKAIKECFKQNIDDVVQGRTSANDNNQMSPLHKEQDVKCSVVDNVIESDYSNDEEPDLDITTLEVNPSSNHKPASPFDVDKVVEKDYKKAYEELKQSYATLQQKHDHTIIQMLEKENQQLWKLLNKFAEK